VKIVIEGPSAVGKTTLCQQLTYNYNSIVVDEVIVEPLRGFTPYEEALFYLDKEVNRWNTRAGAEQFILLDTDPLKSLWFNWSMGYSNCLTLQELDEFYRDKVRGRTIDFADLYIILNASEEELLNRKNADAFRDRENFEWISKANRYRERYYQYLSNIMNGHVVFLEVADPVRTYEKACKSINSALPVQLPGDVIYGEIIDWLRKSSINFDEVFRKSNTGEIP